MVIVKSKNTRVQDLDQYDINTCVIWSQGMDSSYHVRTQCDCRKGYYLRYCTSLVYAFICAINILEVHVDAQNNLLKDNWCASFIQFTHSSIVVIEFTLKLWLAAYETCICNKDQVIYWLHGINNSGCLQNDHVKEVLKLTYHRVQWGGE